MVAIFLEPDTGHFAPETHVAEIAHAVREFLSP